MHYKNTTNLSTSICTSTVASNQSFYPNASDDNVLWQEYRTAGGDYADWSITLTSLSCRTGSGLCADLRKIWKNTTIKHLRGGVRYQMNGENVQNRMLLKVWINISEEIDTE